MNVQVNYGDQPAKLAKKLLKAAEREGLEVAVVTFSPDGYFVVPETVADAAGLSYELLEDEEHLEDPEELESEQASEEPTAESDGTEANPEPDGEPDAPQGAPDADGEPETEPEPEPLRGQALDEALREANLSTSGRVADKQARLAEHNAKG